MDKEAEKFKIKNKNLDKKEELGDNSHIKVEKKPRL